MNFVILIVTPEGLGKCRFFQKIPEARFDTVIKPLLAGKSQYEAVVIEEREFPHDKNRACSGRWQSLAKLPIVLAEDQEGVYFSDPAQVLLDKEKIVKAETFEQMGGRKARGTALATTAAPAVPA